MELRELVAVLKSANSTEEIDQRREEIGGLILAVKVRCAYEN